MTDQKNKKREFVYSGDEIKKGKTRYGTTVFDGIFACVGTNRYVRVKEQSSGTNLIRRRGKVFKVKGKDDIGTSIDWY